MSDLILTTFSTVPKIVRGLVRDLRVRWALEEAGLTYRVATVPPMDERFPDYWALQPFGQVPVLTDGGQHVFESGAILLHLGDRSPVLLPTDPTARSQAVQWVFAALNSVEMAALPWMLHRFNDDPMTGPGAAHISRFLTGRLDTMERVLSDTEWLAGDFSVADILMADVLRQADTFDALSDHPSCRAYVTRATARPAFARAMADQLALFNAADAETAAREATS